jgi:hypothetical protein
MSEPTGRGPWQGGMVTHSGSCTHANSNAFTLLLVVDTKCVAAFVNFLSVHLCNAEHSSSPSGTDL